MPASISASRASSRTTSWARRSWAPRSTRCARASTRPSSATRSTSPGGTSAAAIYELEKGRIRTIFSDAVWAAYRRTVELGERLEAEVEAEAG